MAEIVYDARPELRRPGRFLTAAGRDLWRSLPIAWHLFRTILRVKHRRAWFGYLWLLLPAIGTATICTLIQSQRIVVIPPTDLPYPMFVFSGIILWQVFVEAINAPLAHLNANRQLISRTCLPHEAVLIAGFLEVFISFVFRYLVLGLLLLFFLHGLSATFLLVPVGAIALALLGIALGLSAAPLGLLYNDVERAIALGLSFLFFLTPILYPLPSGGIFRLNLVTPLLSTTRSWLTVPQNVDSFLLVAAASLILLVVAWLFYRLARPHVIARLG